jgi:RNA polymerase sigma-70 factor (family 1)
MDEVVVISGLIKKDIKAFDAVYDLLFNAIFFFTKNITKDEEEAADITTDAFAKVWERHSQFESLAQVRNFLFRAARNASISYLRSLRAKNNYATHLSYLSAEEEENLIERYTVEAMLLQKLYHEIEKLPKKMQEVFKLCYIEGLPKAQVAEQLHMAEKTVHNTCSEALKKLRLMFSEEELLVVFVLLADLCKI